MEFRNACKNTLEAIDDGMSLTWILTDERHHPSFDVRDEENIQKRTNAPTSPRKEGKHRPPGGKNTPQAQQNGQQGTVIIPNSKNGPLYESTSASTTE